MTYNKISEWAREKYKRIAFFDIETDGLLTWQVSSKDDHTVTQMLGAVVEYDGKQQVFDAVHQLVDYLNTFDLLVAHNGVVYDRPCLEYLTGMRITTPVLDTIIAARLTHLDLKNDEFEEMRSGDLKVPSRLIGLHSLEAWGYRIGELKGDSGCETKQDWKNAKWTPEMETYCRQDVTVTRKLFEYLPFIPENVLEVEHQFATNMVQQQKNGVRFDLEHAVKTRRALQDELDQVVAELKATVPPWQKFVRNGFRMYVDESGKRRRSATKEDIYETVEFNPGSGDHIAHVLTKVYGWVPKEFTKTKKPVVDEATIEKLKYPIVPLLLRHMLLKKRLGQLAEGRENLIDSVLYDGRIHGTVNTLGTVSTRCSHAHPNLAQVPSVKAEFGGDFRACFLADPGWVLVGADAAALELRCLSHYLAKWDGGAYGKIVCEGKQEEGTDIHTVNQKAARLKTRDQAKTFIYALIYGAGDMKIGSIVGKGRRYGRQLKDAFIKNIRGFRQLLDGIAKATQRGYLVGLDGRHLPVRSEHSALNLLLQGCGAIIMKYAQVKLQKQLEDLGIPHKFLLNIHDEFQITTPEEHGEAVGRMAVQAITDVGVDLGFRCPLSGAYSVGSSWKETH